MFTHPAIVAIATAPTSERDREIVATPAMARAEHRTGMANLTVVAVTVTVMTEVTEVTEVIVATRVVIAMMAPATEAATMIKDDTDVATIN